MIISFHRQAWDDYLYWQKTDKAMLRRINRLIQEIQRGSLEGAGKPEPLKFNFSGYWSRRIDDEHRVVYKIDGDEVIIAQLRGHYE